MIVWRAWVLPNGVWEVVKNNGTTFRTIVRGVTKDQAIQIADEHNDAAVGQVKHMVNRFLQWKLPDGGVSFDREPFNKGTPYERKHEPVGTNLLTATQAEDMIRHLLDE